MNEEVGKPVARTQRDSDPSNTRTGLPSASASFPASVPEETYSVEQVLYENVELRRPVSEERLVWLLDRLEVAEHRLALLEAVAIAASKGQLGTEPELDRALARLRESEPGARNE